MTRRIQDSIGLRLGRAASEIPRSFHVILAALILTALAALTVLAQVARGGLEIEPVSGPRTPSGVFRAPHPAIVAVGLASPGD